MSGVEYSRAPNRSFSGSHFIKYLPFPALDYIPIYVHGMKSHLVYATIILGFLFIFSELNPVLKSNETKVCNHWSGSQVGEVN